MVFLIKLWGADVTLLMILRILRMMEKGGREGTGENQQY